MRSRRSLAAAQPSRPQLGPCEAHEREAGLGTASEPAGLAVSLFGGGEITPKAIELAEFVVGVAGTLGALRRREPLARTLRFFEGVSPVPPQPHQLDAVDQAWSAVRHEVGLVLAPAREGGGPLARPRDVSHLGARFEHAAIEVPDCHGRDFAGCHRHDRVVEGRHAFLDPLEPDQRSALPVASDRTQRRVAVTPGDDAGLHERLEAAGWISLDQQSLYAGPHEEIAPLDAVDALFLKETPRAADPAVPLGEVSDEEQAVADPEGEASGADALPALEARAVPLGEQRAALVVRAHQVRGDGGSFEVIGTEGDLGARGRVRSARLAPRLPGEGVSCGIEVSAHRHARILRMASEAMCARGLSGLEPREALAHEPGRGQQPGSERDLDGVADEERLHAGRPDVIPADEALEARDAEPVDR